MENKQLSPEEPLEMPTEITSWFALLSGLLAIFERLLPLIRRL